MAEILGLWNLQMLLSGGNSLKTFRPLWYSWGSPGCAFHFCSMKQQDKYQKKIKKLPWLLYKNSTYSFLSSEKRRKKSMIILRGLWLTEQILFYRVCLVYKNTLQKVWPHFNIFILLERIWMRRGMHECSKNVILLKNPRKNEGTVHQIYFLV